jgi:hypothetical protein
MSSGSISKSFTAEALRKLNSLHYPTPGIVAGSDVEEI